MPAGIVIILILAVLLFLNYGENIAYALALSDKKAAVFLLLLTFFYMIRPFTLEGVTVYWLPYFSLFIYGLYLLSKLEYIFRNIILSISSALLLYGLSLKVLPQPIGLIYEPFVIYAFLLIILNILFSLGKRSVVFNSIFSILIFNTVMIFTETHNSIMSPDAFSAIIISATVSYFPVTLLADKKILLMPNRIFQNESDDQHFHKHKSRKW